MDDYLRIARAYLRGTAAAVWGFMFLCLLTFDIAEAVSAFDGEPVRSQGSFLAGVLSRKSYLAMFAYFNACVLGVLLRDNIARPWASVLPHYRQKHLVVAALIALLFLAIPMFAMEFVGTSDIAPTSVAVIFLTCLAAGLWTFHHPVMGILTLPFLIFVMTLSSPDSGLARFLAGAIPIVSAALIIMSLAALGAFVWRLLALNEEMLEYKAARVWGNFFRGGSQSFQGRIDDYLAALPGDKRATFQNFDWQKNPFANLRQIDNLSGHGERNLWQRLQLWRLGTAPTHAFASVGWLVLITFIMMSALLYPQLLPARNMVVIFSVQVMMNPFSIWLFWFMRRRRLGYESLRPRTRSEFIRELGLAFLRDIIQCWLGGVLLMGISAAIWAPELLEVKNLILFVFCTGAGQLCVYAMGIWSLKQGIVSSVSWAFGAFMVMAQWMIWVMDGSIGLEANVATASVLMAASVAAIAMAYRRWLRADLD
ncbi:hypothetical protein [Zavarzinella formosa]|uniref:hypothetical protein n=1 Tax=Zavarzinella formosa TaxID=360055 RepID=UPI0002E0F6EA|nr:hypothetical protein [Zavarzinella formosa]